MTKVSAYKDLSPGPYLDILRHAYVTVDSKGKATALICGRLFGWTINPENVEKWAQQRVDTGRTLDLSTALFE